MLLIPSIDFATNSLLGLFSWLFRHDFTHVPHFGSVVVPHWTTFAAESNSDSTSSQPLLLFNNSYSLPLARRTALHGATAFVMNELPIQPSGIFWQDDFITAEHEEKLIHIFRNELSWPDRSGRLSLHYGYTFDYKTFGVDPNIPFNPFPDWLEPLIPIREGRPPDQVCLQHYPPGAGIPPHVDTHSAYDQLYALSLGSPVMMQFALPPDEGEEGRIVEVDLTPRSMLQMSGDSRLHWKHGIRKRKTDTLPDGTVRKRGDRWSITYRWIREPANCGCGNAKLCDTAQRELGIEKEYRWKKGDEDIAAAEEEKTETKAS